MKSKFRKSTFFEKINLVVGFGVTIIGFYIIRKVYFVDGVLDWEMLQTIFIWLILIISVINIAIGEDIKEELALIMRELVEETRVLKEISNDELKEVKILREGQINEMRLLRTDLRDHADVLREAKKKKGL